MRAGVQLNKFRGMQFDMYRVILFPISHVVPSHIAAFIFIFLLKQFLGYLKLFAIKKVHIFENICRWNSSSNLETL